MTHTWATGPNEAGLEFYDLSHPWGHGFQHGRTSRTSRSSAFTAWPRVVS
jgi:hypothetical protein